MNKTLVGNRVGNEPLQRPMRTGEDNLKWILKN
jgi:hypothetical protein